MIDQRKGWVGLARSLIVEAETADVKRAVPSKKGLSLPWKLGTPLQ